MTLDIRIQQATKTYRDGDLASMSEEDLRDLAADYGIDGSETTPLVTLREEIAQHFRNDLRTETYPTRQVATGPSDDEGNPGNDYASLE